MFFRGTHSKGKLGPASLDPCSRVRPAHACTLPLERQGFCAERPVVGRRKRFADDSTSACSVRKPFAAVCLP